MESLLSLHPSKIFAASRFAGKGVQVERVEHRLVPLNKPVFLGPISIAVLVLTIFIFLNFAHPSDLGAVNSPPTAIFTAHPNSGEAALNVSFDARASKGREGETLIKYDWAFGDDHTGSGEIIDHKFISAGKYIVTLTVTDSGGAKGTATATISVREPIPTSELKDKIEKLSDRVEAGRKPEMVRPNKEVEFLFDSVIGDSYSPEDDSADFRFQKNPIVKFWEPRIIYRIRPPTKVRYKSPLADNLPKIDDGLIEDAKAKENIQEKVQHIVDNVRKQLYELSKESELFRERDAEAIVESFQDKLSNFLEDPKNLGKVLTTEIVSSYLEKAADGTCPDYKIEKEAELSDNQAMDYKMRAVEEVLGLDNEDKNIVERIKRAHEAIKNYEWAHDYLRFGVMVNHIPGIKANAISIVLSAYPSYHRFMPGNWDLSRRISVFIAAGTASTEGGEWETTGFVYSYGLGIDLVKGVGLAFGGSTYTTREVGTEDYKAESTISLGIFLSSELWKELFGK